MLQEKIERANSYEMAIFAFDVLDRSVSVKKPHLAQMNLEFMSESWYYPDEQAKVRYIPNSGQMELSDRILSCITKTDMNLMDRKCFCHFAVIRARERGSVLRYCKKKSISRDTFYRHRKNAVEALLRRNSWHVLKKEFCETSFDNLRRDYRGIINI